jgi:flavodoxin I
MNNNKIGIFYSFNTQKTHQAADLITKEWNGEIEAVNAETINGEIFTSFDRLILGVSTWFDGELPNYWDEFIPELEDLDMKGKKIAIFGNGDQKNYAENFCDGIGIMASILEKCGAEIVGKTSAEGYHFEKSKALKNNQFLGLALDFENQADKNKERIKNWIIQLKKEF